MISLKKLVSESILGDLPSSKLIKMKWNPVTQANSVNEDSITSELDELHEAAFSLNEAFATLDPKKVFTVKARSTVEAIKKAANQAGITGDGWMATQTHKLVKVG